MSDSAVFHETDDDSFRDASGPITEFPGAGGGAVDSVFGRTGTVAAATSDYDAVQVDFTPAGTIAATNVQAAIEEVAAEASGAVSSVFTRTGAVVAAAGDYTAAQVTNTPAGGIAATTVQAAIDELDAEKQPLDADLTTLSDLTAATDKATPVDADLLPVADSAASFAIKKLTWANLKATLKTYFDTLYQAAGVPASLTYSQVNLSGDTTTTTANTYYDGPSVTLAAGTWFLVGHIVCTHPTGGTVHGKLWDGTTVLSSDEVSYAAAGAAVNMSFEGVVVLSGSTTMKISAAHNINGGAIRQAGTANTSGNNASRIAAVKIA